MARNQFARSDFPVESEMENIHRRAALEDQLVGHDRVPSNFLQQIQKAQHLVERRSAALGHGKRAVALDLK